LIAKGNTLDSAAQVTRSSGSSFLVSFAFLSKERRRGISAIYAFCRAVDDAVDEAENHDAGVERLAFWRDELDKVCRAHAETRIGQALQETIERFEVPQKHLHTILEGVGSDLEEKTYADCEALEAYCFKVASAVGLACLPVFGVAGTDAERYAERLGLALQLTNILRDVKADALEGRVYLPQDRIRSSYVETAWLEGSGPEHVYRPDGPVHQLFQGMVEVARQRFAEASAALSQEIRKPLLPAEIMAAVYAELLQKIAGDGWRLNREGRIRISKPRRVVLALRTWWRGKR
jgi:phytoene synthase